MSGCVFCDEVIADVDLVVDVSETMVAFAPLQQRSTNRGHTLVAPREHVRDLHELPVRLAGDLVAALQVVALGVQRTFSADGTSLRQNNGPPGQDVFHLHFHVIPRYERRHDMGGRWESLDRQEQRESAARLRHAIATLDTTEKGDR